MAITKSTMLIFALFLLQLQAAQALLIDSFQTDQNKLSLSGNETAPVSNSAVTTGDDILGGEREIQISIASPSGTATDLVTSEVSNDELQYSYTEQARTEQTSMVLTYDGNNDGTGVFDDPVNGFVDLFATGHLFRIGISQTAIDTTFTVTLFNSNGMTISASYTATSSNPQIGYLSANDDFAKDSNFVNFDLLKISALQLTITAGNIYGVTQLDFLDIGIPEPATLALLSTGLLVLLVCRRKYSGDKPALAA